MRVRNSLGPWSWGVLLLETLPNSNGEESRKIAHGSGQERGEEPLETQEECCSITKDYSPQIRISPESYLTYGKALA